MNWSSDSCLFLSKYLIVSLFVNIQGHLKGRMISWLSSLFSRSLNFLPSQGKKNYIPGLHGIRKTHFKNKWTSLLNAPIYVVLALFEI